MARIALAGFLHETNTFSRQYADFDAFAVADAWPGLVVGQALFDSVAGANLASAGFIEQARRQGHELLPVLWASASPSGCVTRHAYEKIWSMMQAGVREAGRIDAVFLDLHGAMVAEHLDDGEGELLARMRRLVGPAVPIVLTLDFHANVSPAMVAMADAITLYRTYPHVDMADAGARAALLLQRLLDGETLHKAYRQLDFLIPMLAQCTLVEPFASLMRELTDCRHAHSVSADIAAGFPLADTFDCGPAVLAFGADPAATEAVAQRLYEAMRAQRPHYTTRLYSPEEALTRALAHNGDGPFIIADTQDNPGGGGSGDTSDMLHELVRRQAAACVALLCDPAAAQAAHLAGVGASVTLELGGHSGIGAPPLKAHCRVEALGDGDITGTGPFYLGCRMALGPMACLRLDRLLVLVSSRKQQAADQAMLRHLGIDPGRQRILVLKSSIHFRADFGALAGDIICVEAPGANVADIAKLHYSKLRDAVSRA
ncbi:MAG: M81 family metallopeptidase [Telluria sp.]|nr:M81 family metallopeptidase [Telluria sp.]